jgi:hypothetical protein
MDLDPLPPLEPTWHGHLQSSAAPHAPQGGGRTVTQNRVRPVREHGGHPAPVLREEAMADRVDAAVDSAEPLELQSVVDRIGANAKL